MIRALFLSEPCDKSEETVPQTPHAMEGWNRVPIEYSGVWRIMNVRFIVKRIWEDQRDKACNKNYIRDWW